MRQDIESQCLKTLNQIVQHLQRCKTYAYLKLIEDAVMAKLIIPFGERADFYVQVLRQLIKDKEEELQKASYGMPFSRSCGHTVSDDWGNKDKTENSWLSQQL